MDALCVILRDLVGDGSQVGDVATDEEVGVEVRELDLLRQVCSVMFRESVRPSERFEQVNANVQVRNGMTPAQR